MGFNLGFKGLTNIIKTLSGQLHFQGQNIEELYFYHVVYDVHSICKNA